jgi:hypothetical protein
MHLFINVDQQFRENVVTILKNVAPTTLKKNWFKMLFFSTDFFFKKCWSSSENVERVIRANIKLGYDGLCSFILVEYPLGRRAQNPLGPTKSPLSQTVVQTVFS